VCRDLHTRDAKAVLGRGQVWSAAVVPQIGETAVEAPHARWHVGPGQGAHLAAVSRGTAVVPWEGATLRHMRHAWTGHQRGTGDASAVPCRSPCLARQDGSGEAMRIWYESGRGVGTKRPLTPVWQERGASFSGSTSAVGPPRRHVCRHRRRPVSRHRWVRTRRSALRPVSSSSPFRTGREAFTSHGSALSDQS
jgi:hypothetical protein